MLFLEVNTEFFYQPRLQLVNASKAELIDTCQALCVSCPLLCGTFVATDVDIVVGEDVCNIIQYTLEEVNHLVVANV